MATRAILASRQRHVLAAFAASRVVVAFDYDGTLAPIAPTPERARMRVSTRRLLARVAGRYPCVVISGRALADIAGRLDGIPVQCVFGNHGLESTATDAAPDPHVRTWVRALRRRLAGQPGVRVEDKRHSVAIHYRAAPDRDRAAAAIEHALEGLHDARIIGGLEAVNLLPRRRVHKGTALRQAMRLCASRRAIYVGDEQTDEDAFAACGPDRLLGVRVGASRTSHAGYHLASQTEVDVFLRALAGLRPPHADRDY